MAKQEIKFSANFKRDYIAVSAIVLFFAIVAAEVVLAISIPAYLSRESSMAFEVRRIRLLSSFDAARRVVSRKTPSDPTAAAEMKLLGWELDNLAMYLRVNRTLIDSDEVAALQKEISEIQALLERLERNRPFSQEYRLDVGSYLDPLVPEVPAAFAKPAKTAAVPAAKPVSKPAAKSAVPKEKKK